MRLLRMWGFFLLPSNEHCFKCRPCDFTLTTDLTVALNRQVSVHGLAQLDI